MLAFKGRTCTLARPYLYNQVRVVKMYWILSGLPFQRLKSTFPTVAREMKDIIIMV